MKNCLFCEKKLIKRVGKDNRLERPVQFNARKFCNKICTGNYKSLTKSIKKQCPVCSITFTCPNSYNQKTCSRLCSNKHLTIQEVAKTCVFCKKDFSVKCWHNKNAPSKYCTSKCYWESLKGPNSILWKGGRALALITSSNKRRALKMGSKGQHTSAEWQSLKQKYNNMCLCCKRAEPEIKLTRDHVIPLVHKGTNDISNIQPLCMQCNSKKHVQSTDYRSVLLNVV